MQTWIWTLWKHWRTKLHLLETLLKTEDKRHKKTQEQKTNKTKSMEDYKDKTQDNSTEDRRQERDEEEDNLSQRQKIQHRRPRLKTK